MVQGLRGHDAELAVLDRLLTRCALATVGCSSFAGRRASARQPVGARAPLPAVLEQAIQVLRKALGST
jgi:hypothetical protein